MKNSVFVSLGALLLSTLHSFAAPVPMAEIMSTPAGRWLMRELSARPIEGTPITEITRRALFEQKFREIRARYREKISATDGAFIPLNTAEFDPSMQLALELIARDEIGEGMSFISRRAARETFEATRGSFLGGQSEYRALGTGGPGEEPLFHLIERPFAPAAPVATRSHTGTEVALREILAGLGVRSLGGRVLVVPGANPLNRFLERLNAELVGAGGKKVPLRFVEMDRDILPQLQAHAFAQEQFPLRLSGDLGGQDPVVQLGAIFLTEPQMQVMQLDTYFLRTLRLHLPQPLAESPEVARAIDDAWKGIASRLGLNPELHAAQRNLAVSFRTIPLDLSRGGETLGSPFRPGGRPSERIAKLLEYSTALQGREELRSSLLGFVKQFGEEPGMAFLNEASTGFSPGQAERDFVERIHEIHRAVQALARRSR